MAIQNRFGVHRESLGSDERVWRPEPYGFYWLAFAFIGLGSVASVAGVGIRDAVHRPGGVTYPFFLWLAIAFIIGIVCYRWTIYPRLAANSNALTVTNPGSRRVLSWDEIDTVVIKWKGGLTVQTKAGRSISVRAMSVPRTAAGDAIGGDERRSHVAAANLRDIHPSLNVRVESRPQR